MEKGGGVIKLLFCLRFFRVPSNILPEIRSSSEIYAPIAQGKLQGIPIAGVSDRQWNKPKFMA